MKLDVPSPGINIGAVQTTALICEEWSRRYRDASVSS